MGKKERYKKKQRATGAASASFLKPAYHHDDWKRSESGRKSNSLRTEDHGRVSQQRNNKQQTKRKAAASPHAQDQERTTQSSLGSKMIGPRSAVRLPPSLAQVVAAAHIEAGNELALPSGGFLRDVPPYRDTYRLALETSYEGFLVDKWQDLGYDCGQRDREAMPDLSRDRIATALHSTNTKASDGRQEIPGMWEPMAEKQRFFRTDVTQPFGLGTPCAPTYVTRCLVGDYGTTYKYLGLRMFSHCWDKDGSSESCLDILRNLRDGASRRTTNHLDNLARKRNVGRDTLGSNKFDICLVNRMDPNVSNLKPITNTSIPEPNGTKPIKVTTVKHVEHPCTVSWHADSSLEHYSTIAVYQCLIPQENGRKVRTSDGCSESSTDSEDGGGWAVALRVVPHAEGPRVVKSIGKSSSENSGSSIESSVDTTTPSLLASLPNHSMYYLLDDFNHHHQHAVVTTANKNNNSSDPSFLRYSCTFRKLRESHNVSYMLDRCQTACSQFHKKGFKLWRSEQLLLSDIESDWIRQFYIQGEDHYQALISVWGEPMRKLLEYWTRLEARTKQTIDFLLHAAEGKCLNGRCDTSSRSVGVTSLSRQDRKHRDRCQKSRLAMEEVLDRSAGAESGTVGKPSDTPAVTDLYDGFAKLVEDRATMRELWSQRAEDPAFRQMPSTCRPLPAPFVFEVPGEHDTNGSTASISSVKVNGTSPLVGTPVGLRKVAQTIRKSGRAYATGDQAYLDHARTGTKDPSDSMVNSNDSPYRKQLDWSGWSRHVFALEMQLPWSEALLNGTKTVEVRRYSLPTPLINSRIWILQSPSGTAGKSAVPDVVCLKDNVSPFARIVGWCSFREIKEYKSRSSFKADVHLHGVSDGSGYGWSDGDDLGTTRLFGWIVGSMGGMVTQGETIKFSRAVRRFRSLYQVDKELVGPRAPLAGATKSRKRRRF
jgi:FTO catalytic domain/FTO C-terminal domain